VAANTEEGRRQIVTVEEPQKARFLEANHAVLIDEDFVLDRSRRRCCNYFLTRLGVGSLPEPHNS
jgi:hypothetical protein